MLINKRLWADIHKAPGSILLYDHFPGFPHKRQDYCPNCGTERVVQVLSFNIFTWELTSGYILLDDIDTLLNYNLSYLYKITK
ncbi:hypothetical protein H8356DRAFT_1425298 [Neocallimastix lanati (nom. inval.)]|nr:hypothetical protein H8356DRAFT_1425298 [Neocallimastix sp. JGI-2020a]